MVSALAKKIKLYSIIKNDFDIKILVETIKLLFIININVQLLWQFQ